jgi:hypothetical protein
MIAFNEKLDAVIMAKNFDFLLAEASWANLNTHWQATLKGQALRSKCRGFKFKVQSSRSETSCNVEPGTLSLEL